MKKYYSLSSNPGKTGELYYNKLFTKFGLDCTYGALKCDDIKDGVELMKSMKADGFSVSMPFKNSVLKLIDALDSSVLYYKSCNTVVLEDGRYVGYNTDIAGVKYIESIIPKTSEISILGDGSIASMFKKTLLDRAEIYSRKLGNWGERYKYHEVIINCTSFGTATYESPFKELPHCELIIDMAIKSNQLQEQAAEQNIKYIPGIDFYKHQFIEQFKCYTGLEITINDIKDI